jgi:hypothetical protein
MSISQSTGFHGSFSFQAAMDDDDDDGGTTSLVLRCPCWGDLDTTVVVAVVEDNGAAAADEVRDTTKLCRLVMDMPRPSSD